ncbi:MAG: aminotransferase class V-fold PLP-dependent enzyme [Dehalococcoidia bacterium]|nr:aminotransferase class V-fold PLP-dependent enzyme [Dehalococcoidia bacterium]
MRMETLAVHAGRAVDPATGAVTPPIHLSTTFERAPDGSYPRGYLYGRDGNPNRAALEECLRELEGGAEAAAFASGSAASQAVLMSLSPGSHVVAPRDVYHGTARLMREIMAPWGLDVTFVDMDQPDRLAQALRPHTGLVWIETPSNPLLKITDIAAAVDAAHQAGAVCVCDNTFATPVLQRPLDLGADLVVHATTKYLGGHTDVLGGVVIGRTENDMFRRIRDVQVRGGAVPSPFDCWLVLRSIGTLPYRMRGHCDNAAKVAAFLDDHPGVEAVYYPGLRHHAGHHVAARQMRPFGGMVSFQVRGGRDGAMAVAAAVKIFTRASSLGGVESLIEHRASIEGPGTTTPENLLRMSVGLENADDLIEDLAQALSRAMERDEAGPGDGDSRG